MGNDDDEDDADADDEVYHIDFLAGVSSAFPFIAISCLLSC